LQDRLPRAIVISRDISNRLHPVRLRFQGQHCVLRSRRSCRYRYVCR
jgi:hypothetical protein